MRKFKYKSINEKFHINHKSNKKKNLYSIKKNVRCKNLLLHNKKLQNS